VQRPSRLSHRNSSMARFSHLLRRFFGSLRPGGPSATEQAWAESQLLPGEKAIWLSLSGPDRRHSAAVARRVEESLGSKATRPVLAAALLHDCGKLDSGLRTPGRVIATVLAASIVKSESDVQRWSLSKSSWKRSVSSYRRHPDIGAELLTNADSDLLTATWAKEHHLPPSMWTLDPAIAAALHEADDD
jgi:hypothetical protein